MPTQSEAELENDLIAQLVTLGYTRVTIHTDAELRANLRQQLSAFNAPALNHTPLSKSEFDKVLNHLSKGNIFARAQTLRDRYQLTRDDGTAAYVRFFDSEQWCQNLFQVTDQVTISD